MCYLKYFIKTPHSSAKLSVVFLYLFVNPQVKQTNKKARELEQQVEEQLNKRGKNR